MPLTVAYLALGSNVGRRLEQMRSALKLLREKGVVTVISSPVYENRAIGMGSADPFLNAVIQIQTQLDPQILLETCLEVETRLGRVRAKAWSPRTIDIDILDYGQLQSETNQLRLPHPRIIERDFVLQPFSDIAPDFELHGKSIRLWLEQLPTIELTLTKDSLI